MDVVLAADEDAVEHVANAGNGLGEADAPDPGRPIVHPLTHSHSSYKTIRAAVKLTSFGALAAGLRDSTGGRMEGKEPTARPALWRWLVVAVVIGVGIVLFFMYAPGTPPVVEIVP